tara:strand:- start:427 stop:837 length:411 start_codon:yes stop_codon:yes gene_type:complete
MRKIFLMPLILGFIIAPASFAQTAEETDAEPGYWTNLFTATIRYTVQIPESFDVDTYFDRGGELKSDLDYAGTWWVEGDEGSQMFCYSMTSNEREPAQLSECFPLVLMNNPRIGAKWPGFFKEGIMYEAIVVEGRP